MEHILGERIVRQQLNSVVVEKYIAQVERTLVDFLCNQWIQVHSEKEMSLQKKYSWVAFYMKKFRETLHTLLSLQACGMEVQYMERWQIPISDEIDSCLPLLHFSVQKQEATPRDALFLNAEFHGNETLGTDILLSLLQKQKWQLHEALANEGIALFLSIFPNPWWTVHSNRWFSDGADPLRNFQEDFTAQEIDAFSQFFKTKKRGFTKFFQLLWVSWQKKSSSWPWYMGKETSIELQAIITTLQEISNRFERLLFVDIHSGTFAPGVLSPTYASSFQQQNFYDPLFADIKQYLANWSNTFSSSFSLWPFLEYHRHGDFTELLSLLRIIDKYFWEDDNRMMRELYFLTVEADGIGYEHFVQRIKKKREKVGLIRKKPWLFSRRLVMYVYLVIRYFMQSPRMKWLNPSKWARKPLTNNHVNLLEHVMTFFAKHETSHEGE